MAQIASTFPKWKKGFAIPKNSLVFHIAGVLDMVNYQIARCMPIDDK